jgi:hypothetical protein
MDVRGEALGVRVRGRGWGLREWGSWVWGSGVLMFGADGRRELLLRGGEEEGGTAAEVEGLVDESMPLEVEELRRKGKNLESRRPEEGLLTGEGVEEGSGETEASRSGDWSGLGT